MASLQSACVVLSTNPRSLSSSSKPLLAKPCHLLPHANGQRFQVSCNANKKSTSQGATVDRRNMLLGLGGLYGAANLVSIPPANADGSPVQAPDFTKCGDAFDIASGDKLDIHCCPPLSETIIDYKLPPMSKLRMRPPAHKATPEQVAKYELAIQKMKDLDKTDPTDPRGFTQQAHIHCAYCNGAHDQVGFPNLDLQVHNSWLFFPFHRWYLYFYERILGNLIGDDEFALPFWNWDHPKGMTIPPIFDNPNSPLYDVARDPNCRLPAVVNLTFSPSTDPLQLVSNNLSSIYNEMVRSVNAPIQFMGNPYCAGVDPSPGAGSSENGSHTGVHWWVGTKTRQPPYKYNEDMGNFYSAGFDPVFYCHHSNVDRMWTLWRNLKTPVPKDITSENFKNAEFLFYDENKQLVRVKAGDSIDQKKLGYDYQQVDLPWLNYRPPKKAAKVKVKTISNAPDAKNVVPVKLKKILRVMVPKSAKGKVSEQLVLSDIETDTTKVIKFDVFVNDEDDKVDELDRAEYVGSFAQIPHRSKSTKAKSSITLDLTKVYEDIDVTDDDTILVTIVPKINGDDVTIGGIKIDAVPPRSG